MMKYKHASTVSELQNADEDYIKLTKDRPYLNIIEWGVADVDANDVQLGLSGSPTKVKKVDNVVFTAKEAKILSNDETEIENLIKELISNHSIG